MRYTVPKLLTLIAVAAWAFHARSFTFVLVTFAVSLVLTVFLYAWHRRDDRPTSKDALLESAWGIIANAGGSNWSLESVEWREAASGWRDQYFATTDADRRRAVRATSKIPLGAPTA